MLGKQIRREALSRYRVKKQSRTFEKTIRCANHCQVFVLCFLFGVSIDPLVLNSTTSIQEMCIFRPERMFDRVTIFTKTARQKDILLWNGAFFGYSWSIC